MLQHLLEPEKAVAEIARLLRPGGPVALLDTDGATTILRPDYRRGPHLRRAVRGRGPVLRTQAGRLTAPVW